MAFCGLRQAFLISPFHDLSTLAFKGMHQNPHTHKLDKRAYFRPKLQPEYRLPGATLHIRWHRLWISTYLFTHFYRTLDSWDGSIFAWASSLNILKMFSPLFLLSFIPFWEAC